MSLDAPQRSENPCKSECFHEADISSDIWEQAENRAKDDEEIQDVPAILHVAFSSVDNEA